MAARRTSPGSSTRGRRSAPPQEQLRRGIEEALVALGQGFLAHPANQDLRLAFEQGTLTPKQYFDQLLRLVYRLLFLLTVEDRGLLHPAGADNEAIARYAADHGLARFGPSTVGRDEQAPPAGAWEAAKVAFHGLEHGDPRLGLPALSGLFDASRCPALDDARLEDRAFSHAVVALSWRKGEAGFARVRFRDLGSEELGSVYQSLLELSPRIAEDGLRFAFATGEDPEGHTRRRRGSYYTPDHLVQAVLERALEPVVQETIAAHPDAPAEALLRLAIVDPACGSGVFLLAAARRLAAHVARLGTNENGPEAAYRHALREVVERCLHGVDLDPLAVELCQLSLWLEVGEAGLPLTFLATRIQQGNALLGATSEGMADGVPSAAWGALAGEDRKTAAALKKRNQISASQLPLGEAVEMQRTAPATADEACREQRTADAWCAAFLWPKVPGEMAVVAPTNDVWRRLRDGVAPADPLLLRTVEALAEAHGFFHWHLRFPQVFAAGGFDVVLGNPPWIAHAGRAAQPLLAGVKRFYECNWEAFADYPTTHGMFTSAAARLLRTGGRLGLIIPSSLSELGGYLSTRKAHDRLCDFEEELLDFGESQFEGVTQPCMALVSRRTPGGRSSSQQGEPWPMQRPDLTPPDRQLLARLAALPTLPPELFGERGLQSDPTLACHFVKSPTPVGRFTVPIREGTDVRERTLLPPRFHVDRPSLGARLRSQEEFRAVAVVVRQTARYPIAAISDGGAFRNSLLAGLRHPAWPAEALVALLNSALVRWTHYQRFRDARQPVMPQVKISHLRAIPAPPGDTTTAIDELSWLGAQAGAAHGEVETARGDLDLVVARLYGLTAEESARIAAWHHLMGPGARPRPAFPLGPQTPPGAEDPGHGREAEQEKNQGRAEARAHPHVGDAVEAPAEAAYQINDRIEERDLLPEGRQHVDGVEAPTQKRERRHHHHGDDGELLPAVRPDADEETKQAERDGCQHQKGDHPERVDDGKAHEETRCPQDDEPEQDRFGGRRADVTEHDLRRRDGRREHLVDRPRELGHVDPERGVGDALRKNRQHDQPRHDEGAVADPIDAGHARADGRAEDDEIQRGGDHRGGDALNERPERARELEAVDRRDGVAVHDRAVTRPRKMSSNELSRVCRSLKSTPRSASPRRSAAMPVCSALASKV